MHSDARTFIDALFARCARSNYITLTALPPNPNVPTPSRHTRLNDATTLSDALEHLAAANRLGWSGVVGIGTRRADIGRWRRGGKCDLAELPALFVDIDQLEGVEQRIAGSPLPPSCTVASGKGIHLYFYLEQPSKDWDAVTRVLRDLAAYFKGDAAITIAQSMRLPGTVNPKSGRDNALCHILDLHPQRRYALTDFAPFIQPQPRTIHLASWTSRGSPSDDLDWNATHVGNPNPLLVRDVMRCLIADYGGRMQANGWLAACCPCGHSRDSVGAHFGFNPAWGIGVCFGRHGRLRLIDLCPLLGMDLNRLEWAIWDEGAGKIA